MRSPARMAPSRKSRGSQTTSWQLGELAAAQRSCLRECEQLVLASSSPSSSPSSSMAESPRDLGATAGRPEWGFPNARRLYAPNGPVSGHGGRAVGGCWRQARNYGGRRRRAERPAARRIREAVQGAAQQRGRARDGATTRSCVVRGASKLVRRGAAPRLVVVMTRDDDQQAALPAARALPARCRLLTTLARAHARARCMHAQRRPTCAPVPVPLCCHERRWGSPAQQAEAVDQPPPPAPHLKLVSFGTASCKSMPAAQEV